MSKRETRIIQRGDSAEIWRWPEGDLVAHLRQAADGFWYRDLPLPPSKRPYPSPEHYAATHR